MSRRTSRRAVPWRSRTAREYADDLDFLKRLVETGAVKTVIDRAFPLERTADAHRYVDTGEKKGSVVITVDHDEPV
jgi:NADPH:quinone reductase-like Zn-dependent oxidoreductase